MEMDDKVIEVWSRYRKMESQLKREYQKYLNELLINIAKQGGTVTKETMEKYSSL